MIIRYINTFWHLYWFTDIDEDPATNKVRCRICKQADLSGYGTWIGRKSLRQHLNSAAHAANVARQNEERARAERTRENLAHPYLQAGSLKLQSAASYLNSSAKIDSKVILQEDINGISIHDSDMPMFTAEELDAYFPGVDDNAHLKSQELLH